MNGLQHLRSRPWMLLVVVIGLVAGHGILFYFLRHLTTSHIAVSGALLSGMILLMIAKHLGLFGPLLRYLYTAFRRRS
jgi:hypothetical protein